jgi:hypothetical protein
MPELVTFAFGDNEIVESNLSGVDEIFSKLRERGLTPAVSFHGENALDGRGWMYIQKLQGTGAARKLGGVSVAHLDRDIGAIVNLLDRKFRVGGLPPVINENATRALAYDKAQAHQAVFLPTLGPRGLAMPTELASSPDVIAQFVDGNPAAGFIVKPKNGSNGKGVQQVACGDVPALFAADPTLMGTQVIQPQYNLSGAFPASVRPYDAASAETFDGWNRDGQTKELRVYGFHSPAGTEVFPVARAIQDGDQWFFVDPQTIPENVLDGTRDAIAEAARVTGSTALYGTVDYAYGNYDPAQEPGWAALEWNGRTPYMIGYDKHAGVAGHLRDNFADQIQATAAFAR